MIAQATPAPRPATNPGTPAMVGNRIPRPHRFHLTDGRAITGDMHRAPSGRLADHLSTLKGYISVTNARCETSGKVFPYIVLNQDHVLFIEELSAPESPVRSVAPGGARNVPR